MENNKKELKDNELSKVKGGSFLDRGHTWSSDPPYRLIVTAIYSCELYIHNLEYADAGICPSCKYSVRNGLVYYCTKRTHEHDPLEDHTHEWKG